MTDAVLSELLAALDVVAFERLPGGVFVRLGPGRPPAWFSRLLLTSKDETSAIEQEMPFLGHFLIDAEDAWRAGDEKRLRSDPFTVTDTTGRDVALVASALVVANRCVLVLESPSDFEERSRALQTARDHVLAHEEHLRRTGALLKDVEAAQRLTTQLTASGLSPDQQTLVAEIGQALASLSASIESLAPLPKGVPRRSHR